MRITMFDRLLECCLYLLLATVAAFMLGIFAAGFANGLCDASKDTANIIGWWCCGLAFGVFVATSEPHYTKNLSKE